MYVHAQLSVAPNYMHKQYKVSLTPNYNTPSEYVHLLNIPHLCSMENVIFFAFIWVHIITTAFHLFTRHLATVRHSSSSFRRFRLFSEYFLESERG